MDSWQKLLQVAIHSKIAPPRPEGYLTRGEIAKKWKLKTNTAMRLLKPLIQNKKVEMIKHTVVIETKAGPMLRKVKMFKIIDKKY